MVSFKPVSLLALALLLSARVNAQDQIIKKDKTTVQATVLEITDDAVRYKRFDFPDGPVYNIKKAETFLIIYKNGKTESFEAAASAVAAAPAVVPPAAAPVTPAAPKVAKAAPSAAPAAAPVAPATANAPAPTSTLAATANELRSAYLGKIEVLKKEQRLIVGFGGYRRNFIRRTDNSSHWDPGLVVKAAYESIGLNKKIGYFASISNVGIGFASNNFFGLSVRNRHGLDINGGPDGSGDSWVEDVNWSKYYLSTYLFKEFDTKFISAGLLGGLGINYNRGVYHKDVYTGGRWVDGPDIATSYITAGLHTGQYLQRYVGTNKAGANSMFLRFGFDQFFMIKGSFSSTMSLTFGI